MQPVAEARRGQERQLPHVSIGERNHDTVWREVLEARERIGSEAGLCLFPIRNNRRSGLFKSLNGVTNRIRICHIHLGTTYLSRLEGSNSLKQWSGTRNAANRFGRDCHGRESTAPESLRHPPK